MLITPCRWRDDAAWRIANDQLSVVVTRTGAQIASLQGADQGPEALWQPPWQPARPDQADERWGPPTEAPLLANICGWNCCLDRFGLRDNDGGRPLHGEAGVTPWQFQPKDDGLLATVLLPIARLELQRHIQLDGDRLVVTTQVRSPIDQDIEWCEHITLGDPLLDGASTQVAAESATLLPNPGAHARSRFAGIAPGHQVAIDAALAMPQRGDPAAGDILALAVNEGQWVVRNQELGWGLHCRYDHKLFPWLCLWTEHRARSEAPWAGVTRARGMECSSKPFPEGEPPASRYPTWQGRPTRLSLRAQTPLCSRVELQWAPLPD